MNVKLYQFYSLLKKNVTFCLLKNAWMLSLCYTHLYSTLLSMLHYSTLMLASDPVAVDEGHPWNIMRHPIDHRIPNEIPLVKHSR